MFLKCPKTAVYLEKNTPPGVHVKCYFSVVLSVLLDTGVETSVIKYNLLLPSFIMKNERVF